MIPPSNLPLIHPATFVLFTYAHMHNYLIDYNKTLVLELQAHIKTDRQSYTVYKYNSTKDRRKVPKVVLRTCVEVYCRNRVLHQRVPVLCARAHRTLVILVY